MSGAGHGIVQSPDIVTTRRVEQGTNKSEWADLIP